MRKVIFILALTVFSGAISLASAQDVITKRNGTEIRAKVIEVGMTDIKYKLESNESGPVYSVPKSELFMILYQNGTKEMYNQEPAATAPATSTMSNDINNNRRTPIVPTEEKIKKGYAGIGIGVASVLEDYELKAGVQFTVNAGYRFGRHVGITGSFINTNYAIKGQKDMSLGLRGGLIGPLISFPVASHKIEIDIRPTVGFVSLIGHNGNSSVSSEDATLAI
ncbi:MAG: hypothetical protein LBH60_06545, partial [Prevotellaceae bacterium]|nr:hypothetical protein [Prevotellaceae bacterium]